MLFRQLALAGLLLGFSAVGGGCNMSDLPGCACTQDFRFLIVNVRDGAGQPVSGVTITVTQLRTGSTLPVQQGATTGTYIYLDDSFRMQIISAGETIRVAGQKGTASFSVEYVVKTDSCGCHVAKVSGPDSITL